jgi:hypothetical protein
MKKCTCTSFALQYDGRCLCGADDYNYLDMRLLRTDAKILRQLIRGLTWDVTNLSEKEEKVIENVYNQINDFLERS